MNVNRDRTWHRFCSLLISTELISTEPLVNYANQKGAGGGMVRDRIRPLVDERGFTLAELLVVIGMI
ncbi:MAG: prepilin-type N-terminal cleavage/methylation domain-containing protein, partial [candidate division NC10 bacterium]